MIFKNEKPIYLVEYAINKLFITGYPSHMFIVINWQTVRIVTDPNQSNTSKTYSFLLPGFNEKTFPFVAVCGKMHLSILNLNSLCHKPLINSRFSSKEGLQGAFAKAESFGLSVHFAGIV